MAQVLQIDDEFVWYGFPMGVQQMWFWLGIADVCKSSRGNRFGSSHVTFKDQNVVMGSIWETIRGWQKTWPALSPSPFFSAFWRQILEAKPGWTCLLRIPCMKKHAAGPSSQEGLGSVTRWILAFSSKITGLNFRSFVDICWSCIRMYQIHLRFIKDDQLIVTSHPLFHLGNCLVTSGNQWPVAGKLLVDQWRSVAWWAMFHLKFLWKRWMIDLLWIEYHSHLHVHFCKANEVC